MTKPRKQEAFGRALKKVLDSKQAHEIIDAHPKIHGTTWMSGSCPVLAAALLRWWPGFELVNLGDLDTGTVHHVLVYADGLYFDGDGASTEEDLLWRWKEEEGLAEPNVLVGEPEDVDDFACPLGAIEDTQALLVDKLGRPSGWGFKLRKHNPQTQKTYGEYTLYATDRSHENEWDIEAYAPGWVKVADAEFAGVYEYDDEGSHLVALKGWHVEVSPEHRRKGLGSAMYCFAEEAFGLPVVPGDVQTAEGAAFLRGRDCSQLKAKLLR